MFHHTPSFPIQVQHIHDDHSMTYSSADSEEDVFSLDGDKMLEEHNHDADSRGGESASMNIPSPSSFVELEQSIHELEKWYAQCIKSSPQKGTNHGKRIKEEGETMIDAKVLLNHGDQPGLACARAPLDLGEVEFLAKQKEMLFKRQCFYQGETRSQYYSAVSVSQHEEGNATKDKVTLKNISLTATSSSTRASNKSDRQMYVHDTQQRYRVSDDFDLEG